MKTVYTFVSSPGHVFPDHPERPARLDVLEPKLNSFDAEHIETQSATREEIAYVHNPKLVSAIEKVCREQAPGIIDYAPTYVTPSSFEDALLAAGGVITCTRAVLDGNAKNAFAIVRPMELFDRSRRSRLSLVGRFDRFELDSDSDAFSEFLVGGVIWDLTQRVSLALDYQGATPRSGAAGAPANTWFLHWVATF